MGMSVRSLYRQTDHGEIKQWKKRFKYPPKVRCEAGATRAHWKRVLSLSPILGKMFPQVHGLLGWTSRFGQIRHLLEVLGVISHHWPIADSTCFPHSVPYRSTARIYTPTDGSIDFSSRGLDGQIFLLEIGKGANGKTKWLSAKLNE